MRIALILITILSSCISKQDNNEHLNLNFKLEVIREILLNSTNEFINRELIIADVGHLSPPVMGNYYNELPFLMEALDEPDSTCIIEQFRERKNFITTKLESDKISILPLSKMPEGSIWEILESDSINGVYSIEMPIFNKDLTKVYFRFGYMCGELCGTEQSYIFEQATETNSWTISKELELSIN